MLTSNVIRHLGVHLARVMSRPLGHACISGSAETGPVNISCRFIDERELIAYCVDPGLELHPTFASSAFDRGDRCVAAFDGGRLIGYEWVAFGPTPHIDGVWVAFDFRARYSYKKFVLPQYRGRHIAGALSVHADRWCARQGYTSTVSFIDIDNQASWRAASHAGSRTMGYAGYFSPLGHFSSFTSPGARKLHFRFYVPRSLHTVGRREASRQGHR